MMRFKKLTADHLTILMGIVFIGAILLAITGPLHDAVLRQREAAKLADLKDQSRYRIAWPAGRWPPPDTPIRIDSAFGRYTIPLENLGGRDEFLLKPLTPLGLSVPLPDGSYDWSSFTLSFWMPDGAGVVTEAPELLTYTYVDPSDLKRRRAPMRPREVGQPDPSPTRYAVVVGEFCPHVGPPPPRLQGSSLTLYGYGYGAIYMYGCSVDEPTPEWTLVDVYGPGRTEIFCHAGEDVCFGWIDLVDEGVRALTYLPRDAVAQAPAIAARMHALLQGWKNP